MTSAYLITVINYVCGVMIARRFLLTEGVVLIMSMGPKILLRGVLFWCAFVVTTKVWYFNAFTAGN